MFETESGADVREIMKGPPSGYFIVVADPQEEGADELASFTVELWAAWKLLLATAVVGGLVAVGIALLMRPSFRAEALVAPVTTQTSAGGVGGALRELGGIAALAGIDVGMGGGRKGEYLATLSSPGLARDFIQSGNLLPILYADRWDPQAKRWRADKKPPTLGQAVKRFTDGVVSISDDRRTSLVTVTVDWYSPQLAAQWANGLIELANDRLRADAIHSAQSSLEYLDKELAKTNVVEIRQAIYQLTEQQVNNAMLANVQREYAYRFIDRAVPPETKFSPKRTVIGAVGAAVGLFLGVMVVYVRRVRARRRELTLRRG
jgi:G-rich domain on putative tyrosine kinase/Chain length determinant protein